jgi:diguanylate cyclase (GGDEF)-like protein
LPGIFTGFPRHPDSQSTEGVCALQFLAFVHLPTLFFLAGLIVLLYTGVQPIAYLMTPDTPGIRKLAAGNALCGLGVLLVLGRAFLPPSLTVVAGNTSIMAGFCLMLAGLRRFNGHPALPARPFVLLFGAYLPALLYFTYFRDDVFARTLLFCLFNGFLSLMVAREATLSFRARGLVRWIYAAVLIFHALFCFLRAFLVFAMGVPGDLLGGGLLVREALLETMAFLFSLSLAFVLMLMHRLSEENRTLAEKDPLTGLLNRRFFMALAERERARAARAGSAFSVVTLDLDHFKVINDTYGHAAGDLALKTLSEKLSELFRKSDLVGRMGGDEFLLLLPETPGSGARVAVEKILEALRESPVLYDGRTIRLTASAGISWSERGEEPLDLLLREADTALYESKRAGRDRAGLFAKPGPIPVRS